MKRLHFLLLILLLAACASPPTSAVTPPPIPSTSPSPTPLVSQEPTQAVYKVKGMVLLEEGACCVGGPVGQPVTITAAFDAKSPSSKVGQMRVAEQCLTPAEMEAFPWEPLADTKDFSFTPPVANWFGFTVGVQYRDEQGNLSEVVCDDIAVEGMNQAAP